MTAQHLTFDSAGTKVVGNLHLPEGTPRGAVVVVGPLTSVKEQAAGVYAAALADRGFVALAFDYRTFGESDGLPRQLQDPTAHVADIHAAAGAIGAHHGLAGLPLFGLGVCFGAAPMVVAAATDGRFRAFAGVAGVYTDRAQTAADLGDAYDAVIARGRRAEAAWRRTGESETIPAVSADGGDVAMPLYEAYEYYGTERGAVANYTNAFAVASFAHLLAFDAQGAADALDVPAVVVHSDTALAPELARRFYDRLGGPKDPLWLDSIGQIDFYDDPRLIGAAADRVAATFAAAAAAATAA